MKTEHFLLHRSSGFARADMVLLVFLAIAAFFMLTEHRAHLFGVLPFLLLLACPLLHRFMHHGHGKEEEEDGEHHAHPAGTRDEKQ